MAHDDLSRLAVLDDPVRRRLLELIRASGEPVSREAAAEAIGIGRTLAAYHLDKLAEEGFLTTSYGRPEGRAGPGAGRPAKLYSPAQGELAVSVPARDYELIARLLAMSFEAAPSSATRKSLDSVARARGRELAAAAGGGGKKGGARRLMKALRERGYEPFADAGGVIRLRNCPFHRLAAEHRDLVCGMNLSLVTGLVDGLGESDLEAALEPEAGRCCVAIRTR